MARALHGQNANPRDQCVCPLRIIYEKSVRVRRRIDKMSAPRAVGQRLNRLNRAGGFTMVEIILVVVIIMTLAAVVGPRLVGKTKQAKINTTKIAMSNVK